ncbi:MAG: hypothetical protein HP498_13595 [Nitrospira sp.]|jgi:hypothetical protein|nr:hypothetical protein [Nitrospira sp.]
MQWEAVGVVVEGQAFELNGLNVWNYEWTEITDDPVDLPHPSYAHQLHRMHVYEIRDGNRRAVFAAGELSANVWGFYVPE